MVIMVQLRKINKVHIVEGKKRDFVLTTPATLVKLRGEKKILFISLLAHRRSSGLTKYCLEKYLYYEYF